MITSRQEYRQFVRADLAAYGLQKVSFYNWLRIDQLRFQLRLRKLEYLTNCRRWRLLSRIFLDTPESLSHEMRSTVRISV